MKHRQSIRHHDIEILNDALARHDVAYLFIGKGAAVLHGFPDTTQDVDIFPRKDKKKRASSHRSAYQARLRHRRPSGRRDHPRKGLRPVEKRPVRPGSRIRARRHRELRPRMEARRSNRTVSRMRARRHYRKQTPSRTHKRQGNLAKTRGIQGMGQVARTREQTTACHTTGNDATPTTTAENPTNFTLANRRTSHTKPQLSQ